MILGEEILQQFQRNFTCLPLKYMYACHYSWWVKTLQGNILISAGHYHNMNTLSHCRNLIKAHWEHFLTIYKSIIYTCTQGCAITIAQCPGLPILPVGLVKFYVVLARRASQSKMNLNLTKYFVKNNIYIKRALKNKIFRIRYNFCSKSRLSVPV